MVFPSLMIRTRRIKLFFCVKTDQFIIFVMLINVRILKIFKIFQFFYFFAAKLNGSCRITILMQYRFFCASGLVVDVSDARMILEQEREIIPIITNFFLC